MAQALPGPGEKMARATFAAILAASNTTCTCEACKILRVVATEIKQEFLTSA